MHESPLTLALIAILVLGVCAQWLAWRLRWPAIVVLVIFGLIAGPASGLLVPSRDLGEIVDPIIKLCVALILFEGGMSLRWHEWREAGAGVRRLLFPALPLNFLLGSLAAHYIGGLSWAVAMVFGAIITVTGPTVIMPLLRQAGLRRRPASFLKWEAIINDPIGALLAVLVFQFFVARAADAPVVDVLLRMGLGAAVALLLGWGGARLLASGMERGWIPEYLKPPVMLMAVLVTYGLANAVQPEAGLLTATVMGMVLANSGLADVEELRRFKEYLTVMLVSTVFILLTSDLRPETLLHLDWSALALILAVLLVVRPVSILIATLGSDMSWQERALVAWIAPRGIVAAAVAGVFGPALQAAGFAQSELLTPLIFVLVLVTVVAHGFSLPWLAGRLGLRASERHGVLIVGASPWSVELGRLLADRGVYVLIADANWQNLRAARLAGLKYYYGEILSEAAEETLDLSDIGYLLAVSDNDAYNSLVCSRFVPQFGRDRVFQLATAAEEQPKQMHHTLKGRTLFKGDARFEWLLERHYLGWRFQITPITAGYTAQDYFAAMVTEALPAVLLRASGALVFRHSDNLLKPEAGDTVVAFLSPQARAERKNGG